MSHYSVLIIGNDVDEQLAPYDESIQVAPVKMHLEEDDVKRMAEYYKIDVSDKEALSKKMIDWHGGKGGGLDKEGLFYWSTYNQSSKWDWYEVGGRWDGSLETKDGLVNEATIGELIKPIEPTFAVVKDGIWYENGKVGMWGFVGGERAEEEWGKEFYSLISGLPSGMVVTIVDCHI